MNKPFKIGLVAGLISAAVLATLSERALAKKAPAVRKQPPIFYRSSDDVRTYTGSERADVSDVIPGLQVDVADIFE